MASPERQCCACRQTRPQAELLRFVCGPEGRAVLDLRGKLPGRGAYLCPDRDCLHKGLQPKGVGRVLGCMSPAGDAEALREQALAGLGRLLREQLGHAHRAGGVVWGAQRVSEALEEGRVDWVLSAADTAERTRAELAEKVGPEKVLPVLSKEEIGEVLGPAEVGVAVIVHPRLAEKIFALAVRWKRLREENGDGQG